MQMRNILVVLLVLIATQFGSTYAAAGTISGTVVYSGDNNPIENVDVQFFDAQNSQLIATSVTGSRGFYNSGSIPDGIYRIRFSSPGYQPIFAAGEKPSKTFCESGEFLVSSQSDVVVNASLSLAVPMPYPMDDIAFQGEFIDGLTLAPIEGIQIIIKDGLSGLSYEPSKEPIFSNESGTFSFGWYAKGLVRLRFYDPAGRYFPEFSFIDSRADDFCLGTTYFIGGHYNVGSKLTPVPTDQQPQVILDVIEEMLIPENVSTSLEAPLIRITDFLTDTNPKNDAAICPQFDSFISRIAIKERTGQLSVEDAEALRQLAETLGLELGCTVPLGSIIVEKQTLPDGGTQLFEFVGDVAGTIGDDQTITIADLPAGTYTASEIVSAGWDLAAIDCDDGTSVTPSTGNVETGVATFNLDLGETVKCTFTNVQRGTIEVVVVVPPSGIGGPPEPLVETFTFHAGGRFRFDGVGGSILTTTLTGEGNTDYGLIATTGPIEVLPENPYLPLGPLPTVLPVSPTSNGWELFSFSCRDGSNPGAGIDVSPGENVVCDFFFYIPQIP